MKIALPAAMLALAAGSVLAEPVTYPIDPAHTYPSFEADHFGGMSVWRGKFDKTSGTIVLDKQKGTGTVDITVDTSSIDFGMPKLNEHARSAEMFDVQKYPTITFKSKKAESAGQGKVRVTGDLTIHGVTKEAVLDVDGPTPPTPAMGGVRMGAEATTKINRKDFGVNGAPAMVGDDIQITLDVEMTHPAGK